MINDSGFSATTKYFVLRVIRLVETLPQGLASRQLGQQLLDHAIAIGADGRRLERTIARTQWSEAIAQLDQLEAVTEDSFYYMELLAEGNLVGANQMDELLEAATTLLAMVHTQRKYCTHQQAEAHHAPTKIL